MDKKKISAKGPMLSDPNLGDDFSAKLFVTNMDFRENYIGNT